MRGFCDVTGGRQKCTILARGIIAKGHISDEGALGNSAWISSLPGNAYNQVRCFLASPESNCPKNYFSLLYSPRIRNFAFSP